MNTATSDDDKAEKSKVCDETWERAGLINEDVEAAEIAITGEKKKSEFIAERNTDRKKEDTRSKDDYEGDLEFAWKYAQALVD